MAQCFAEFLDLEAIDSEDQEYLEEDDGADDLDGFVDDQLDEADTIMVSPSPLIEDNEYEAQSDAKIEGYLSELHERLRKWCCINDESFGGDLYRVKSASGSEPMCIWRVQCKRGSHGRLVTALLDDLKGAKGNDWNVVTIFTLPRVRDWVYFENKGSKPNSVFRLQLLSYPSVGHGSSFVLVHIGEKLAMADNQDEKTVRKSTWIMEIWWCNGNPLGHETGECHHADIAPASIISLFIMRLFHMSSHPIGELVEVEDASFAKVVGMVVATHATNVEVEMQGKGIHCFPFCQVVKQFSVGDYVECLGCKHMGHMGFVQVLEDFHVIILENNGSGTVNKLCGQTVDIGTEVVIFPKGHPLRTHRGRVRDVICGQDNPSGLRLILVLDRYNPELTNKEYTVDYEHVVETQTKLPLRLYKPLDPSQVVFSPSIAVIKSRWELQIQERMKSTVGPLSLECPPTLLKSTNEPYCAAWDPCSKTPPVINENDSVTTSSCLPEYMHQGHWTSNFRLTGYEFRVMIRGKWKTVYLQNTWDNVRVEVYMRKGKTKSQKISAEVVEAMHPTTPQNYECWIVIKGPHTRKYVRSIRYEKDPNPKMPLWWTVAVVQPMSQGHDELLGEELHLICSDLCLEDEDEKSWNRNMQFSQNLREDDGDPHGNFNPHYHYLVSGQSGEYHWGDQVIKCIPCSNPSCPTQKIPQDWSGDARKRLRLLALEWDTHQQYLPILQEHQKSFEVDLAAAQARLEEKWAIFHEVINPVQGWSPCQKYIRKDIIPAQRDVQKLADKISEVTKTCVFNNTWSFRDDFRHRMVPRKRTILQFECSNEDTGEIVSKQQTLTGKLRLVYKVGFLLSTYQKSPSFCLVHVITPRHLGQKETSNVSNLDLGKQMCGLVLSPFLSLIQFASFRRNASTLWNGHGVRIVLMLNFTKSAVIVQNPQGLKLQVIATSLLHNTLKPDTEHTPRSLLETALQETKQMSSTIYIHVTSGIAPIIEIATVLKCVLEIDKVSKIEYVIVVLVSWNHLKHYKETANAFHLRLASDDLLLSKEDYDRVMVCNRLRGIHTHHMVTTPGHQIGCQYISCSRGCASHELLLPSPAAQVELVNIVQEDNLARSVEGKTKTVVSWQIKLDKAKEDLRHNHEICLGTSLWRDEIKQETARIKVIQVQEDLLCVQHERNLSVSASEGLFVVECCTNLRALRHYLLSQGLIGSEKGSPQCLYTSSCTRRECGAEKEPLFHDPTPTIKVVRPHPTLVDITPAQEPQKAVKLSHMSTKTSTPATPRKQDSNDNNYSLVTPPPTCSRRDRRRSSEANSDNEVQCTGAKIGGITITDLSKLVGPQPVVMPQPDEKIVVREESDSEVTIIWSNILAKRLQVPVLPGVSASPSPSGKRQTKVECTDREYKRARTE
ncbi:hypothetical protein EDD85DRAFT_786460 [Armillaria nabsnona]|nr:hypothetical protein EDD85DRAFT_786460 [Armillaria nabsnona]